MSVVLGGYNFQNMLTHQLPTEGDWEYAAVDASFFGVAGAVEITDAEHGRMIDVECEFQRYDTPALLEVALNSVDSKKAILRDATLTVTIAGSPMIYPHCSFRGFTRNGKAYLDGSGINGWIQEGVLHFRQLKRTP